MINEKKITVLKDNSSDLPYMCILEGDLRSYKSSFRSSYFSKQILRKPVLNDSEINVWVLRD